MLSNRASGPLILSSLDLAICLASVLLGLIFRAGPVYPIFTLVLPLLLVITLVWAIIDLVNQDTRRQAVASLLLLLPTLSIQIWFYRGLDM